MRREAILKMDVNVTSVDQAISRIEVWIKKKEAHVVCVSNVHMCMEVYDDPEFADIVNKADKIIPDGKPLSWALRFLGHDLAEQVRGADITLSLCRIMGSASLIPNHKS
jgi:N-acetylglucosaminyldiphosphoundecaprenol N-acetyl-beta-D-mannosaminyltransferase